MDVKPTGSGDYVSRSDWPPMGSVAGTFKKSAAGHPASEAYRPSDIRATVYTALGISPHSEVRDIQDHPMVVNEGEVIRKLF